MVSFAKVTSETYAGLTPVEDRIYYLTDTGEVYLNGTKYGSDPQVQADWDQSDSTAVDYIKNKPVVSANPADEDYVCIYHIRESSFDQQKASFVIKTQGFFQVTPEFEYSFDKVSWSDYTLGTTVAAPTTNSKIWIRAKKAQTIGSSGSYTYFSFPTGRIGVSGNLKYLLSRDLSLGEDLNYAFRGLFNGCTRLYSAPVLPLSYPGQTAYGSIFEGCTGLTVAPVILARRYNIECFHRSFKGCTNLTDSPDFHDNLIETLDKSLSGYSVFYETFDGCTKLKHVRTMQQSWKNYNWLNNVASTGVIECPSALDTTIRDASHIPAGWTVEYIDDVQPDWDESDSTLGTYIKNKPVIPEPTEQEQANWDESDSTSPAYIQNKPDLAAVATSGSYNDLDDTPDIPDPQVQADWDESDSTVASFIKDKPVLAPVATLGTYNSLAGKPNIPYNTGKYLTIWNDTTNTAGSTVVLEKVGSPRDNSFQYCQNGNTQVWYDYTLGSTITLAQYGYVMFRNKDGFKMLGNSTSNYYHFVITGSVYITGDITSMKDKSVTYNCVVGSSDLAYLFKDNTAIKNASGLVLPAPILNSNSYIGMFEGCSSMVYGPLELPAMTLGNSCYQQMFKNCTALKNAPRLPAKVLASGCYNQMFANCQSLLGPIELPAPALVTNCYRLMFNTCYALNDLTIRCSEIGDTYTGNWMTNITSPGVLRCPTSVDVSTRGISTAPASWKIERIDDPMPDWDESDSTETTFIRNKPTIPPGQVAVNWTAPSINANSISNRFRTNYSVKTDSELTILYAANTTVLSQPAGNLTLNGRIYNDGLTNGIAYTEIVIDLTAGSSVTAGTSMTLVDTVQAGKRNYCVCRITNAGAKLFVVDTEDLP